MVVTGAECSRLQEEWSTDHSFSCSCFNAFSRVDIRVDVKIPGGVNAYYVDLRGDRYVIHADFHIP
jgi:hypothetical protein